MEQAAFSPANVVPGMGYSPDKMLQGRLFAYHEAQLYRVGTNHQHLPVNCPRCPFHNQQRDGAMAIDNGGAQANYMDMAVEAQGSWPQGMAMVTRAGRWKEWPRVTTHVGRNATTPRPATCFT